LSRPRERDEDDFLGLAFQDLDNRCVRDPLVRDYLAEDRRLEDAEPDPQPNSHHDEAQPERDAPSPAQELIPRHLTERQDREVREEETCRPAKLRPRRDEPAIFARAGPFHRQQHRAAPFAADPDPLNEAQGDQQNRAPDADMLIGGDASDQKGRQAGQQQCRNQRGFAADAIAVMPKDRRADRTRNEADRENGKRLQDAGQGVRRRKIQFREDQRGHLAIQQEIVPFDCRADRAGDHRAAQLGAVIEVGKWDCSDVGYGHRQFPRSRRPARGRGPISCCELTITLAAA